MNIDEIWAQHYAWCQSMPLTAVARRIAELEAERDRLRVALDMAAGLISTMPEHANKHPEEVREWIAREALGQDTQSEDRALDD